MNTTFILTFVYIFNALLFPVSGVQDVAQGVDHEEVAGLPVQPGAPDHLLVLELHQPGVVATLGHQVLPGQAVAQLVHGGADVLRQRVVHVEPITRDLIQV